MNVRLNSGPAWRLSKYDCVIIGGVNHQVAHATENGYVFARPDRDGLSVQISHADLGRRLNDDIEIRREHYSPADRPCGSGDASMSKLQGRQREVVAKRNAYVQAFLDLEAAGKVQRTDGAINAAMGPLIRAANEIARGAIGYTGDRKCHTPPSSRTLRRWLRDYEHGGGLPALVDGRNRSGRHGSHFKGEARKLLDAIASEYGDPLRPTKQEIHRRVLRAFRLRNEELRAKGCPALAVPSRKATMSAIARLDPFQTDVKRLGQTAALRRHRIVSSGIQTTRLMERVEIDEWKVDLLNLLSDAGLEEMAQEVGLVDETKKPRLWLSVALDVTSRCILAMKLDRTPSVSTAMRTLELITVSKGTWADAVGSVSPWDMYGTPELVVTDCGPAYKSDEFRTACHDLHIAFERAPAGTPWMRPYIERLFRSIGTDLMARLNGRTFSNVLERDDADKEVPPALTAEDLGRALIRWVVDVYHNRPHAGLGGRTPLQVWRTLSTDDQFGAPPPPDARLRRLVFGVRLSRIPQSGGVTVMGVRYQSRGLATWRSKNTGKKVEVRWSPENIGSIEIDLGGGWISVPAVNARLRGVTAEAWENAVRRCRALGAASADAGLIAVEDALKDIDRVNEDACRAAGITSKSWTREALEKIEGRLFIGFSPLLGGEDADRPSDILLGGLSPSPKTDRGITQRRRLRLTEMDDE